MSDPAIRADRLGKQYRIGHVRARYKTLRDALSDGALEIARGIGSRIRHGRGPAAADNLIWALSDFTCDIQRGEVVGIIGGNGAGKSTLLKILSRVTKPTTGHAEITGRVGSLLEVGTGFHPELTGRDNIYLNGAILGMRRTEIRRKFDEIVEFAEVAQFIDTPIKHYSSGMYLRLAFAVAAHLECEILLVDEVLAVGDAAFQRKCLGKMGAVAKEGRTVLFVSHNMDAIQRLCSRSLLLDRGQVADQGHSAGVVSRYLSRHSDKPGPNVWMDVSSANRTGTGEARFIAVQYSSLNDAIGCHAYPGGSLELALVIESDSRRSIGSMAVALRTQAGTTLIDADILSLGAVLRLREGRNIVRLRIKELHLNPGVYVVGLWLGHSFGAAFDHAEAAFEIDVVHAKPQGHEAPPVSSGVVPCDFELLQDA